VQAIRTRLDDTTRPVPATLFGPAQTAVYQLMEKDSYQRFLGWDGFVALKASHHTARWLCM
jgi:hypothetical protein